MAEQRDLLPIYLEHVDARLRLRRAKPSPEVRKLAVLPDSVARLCSEEPRQCLDLIVRALAETDAPDAIEAIGDQLLEYLLNESSGRIAPELAELLRENKKFRQAFACAKHSSVDPALISDWVNILQSLGTTKDAERKSLRKMRRKTS